MLLKFRKTLLLPVLCAGVLAACTDKKAHGHESAATAEHPESTATINKQWEMPAELREISGMAPYKGLFACIEDEDGIIFLFNPVTGEVEKQLPFGAKGDYEGIAVVGETAWVLRSDGQLFEVVNFASGNPAVKSYATPLTQKQDTEGLFYDAAHNRLLVSVKAKDPEDAEAKGVYAFDLQSHTLNLTPVYRLTVTEAPSGKKKGKKSGKLQPSEIAINPSTNELYVLDGPKSILYVMDASGTEKQTYPLDKKDFPQPEGLAFTPDGKFYISTEGGKRSGAILDVTLNP